MSDKSNDFDELLAKHNKQKLEMKKENCIICISDWCDSKPRLLYFDVAFMPFTIDELIRLLWCSEFRKDPFNNLNKRWQSFFYDGKPLNGGLYPGQIYADKANKIPTEPLPFHVSYVFHIDSANW